MTIEITSEADAFQAIDRIVVGEWPEGEDITFVGWPRLEITIQGADFDGGVPTRIMPALLRLQRTVRRAYARIVLEDEDRRLTAEERRDTELVVRLEAGRSTTFLSEIGSALNTVVARAAPMTGTETLLTILGVAAIAGGVVVWKAYLSRGSARDRLDHQFRMGELELRRLETFRSLAEQNLDVASGLADMNDAQQTLLRRLDDDDRLLVDGEELTNGYSAKQWLRRPRAQRVVDRVDGEFIIQSVDSGKVENGYRLGVRHASSDEEMTVDVPEGKLSDPQLRYLQGGEWGKLPLRMHIQVVRIRGEVRSATLVRVGSVDE